MPNDESAFQNWIRGTDWFKEFKAEYNEEPDLDTKDYDYRAAWKAGISPERDPYDQNRFHWPSSLPTGEMLKSAEHPTAWKEYFMRETGVNPDSLGLQTPEDAKNYLKKKSDQKAPNNKGSAMATMLDAVNNPLGPLGLTSLTGTSAKEKPAAPSQAAFPSIERPADPRPEIERRRGEIGLTSSNIDVQIINNLAQQGQFQAEQAQQKAESEAQSLRELDTSRKALEKSLFESPAYKTIQEKSKELAEKSTFNPDQQNAQTLAAVFSIIGAAGFLLGGNNKNTAKAALAAMNGMAEGYSKGRDQYAKEQRQAFETNQKALRGTLDSLEKAFTYEIEQNKGNIESATRNAKIAALERDASFINSNINKYGLVSTLEQLRSNKKRLETVLDALQKKEDAYKSTLEREWFSSEEKKAVAAAAQERVRYQEQERTAREQERRQDQERREKERREDKLSDMTRYENFRREMFFLRSALTSGQKDEDDRQKMGAVEARTLRDTRKLQGDMSSLIDDLQNPTLIKQIDNNRAYAFLSEESKVLDQLLAKKLPPELQSFLLKVRSVRNKYYLDTSGKAVTGGEALRNYGVVAQPGDTAERARQKLEIGLASVEESIKDFQATYKVPKALQERLGEGRVDFATMEEYEKAKKNLKDGQKVRVAGRNAVHQAEK